MKKIIFTIIVLCGFIALPSHNVSLRQNDNKSRFAGDHIIVKLKKNTDILAASFSGVADYQKTLETIFSELKISVKKTKTLYPRDTKITQRFTLNMSLKLIT